MKSWEIIVTVFLVMAGYITADAIASQIAYQGAAERFILRAGILIPYFLLIYLLFEVRDLSSRASMMEQAHADDTDDNEPMDQQITEGEQDE